MATTQRPSAFLLLVALLAASLFAGIGMRDPQPADEPRFVLAADHMVASGDWLFPHRGNELYADKPPMFMWLLAAGQWLTGDWRWSFLLPSWVAAFLTLWFTHDLASKLWNREAGRTAALALFACLQFGLQAKRAQIDMVLVAMTTASLWALLQYLLVRRAWWLLAAGTFAAGLGTVTKGVGFLPLLVFLPWLALRRRPGLPRLPAGERARHLIAGFGGLVVGLGIWLVPMLWAVATSADPALRAYATEILWGQTGTRYATPSHHIKPAWYYLQVAATLWLPGSLLLPWLIPAWWRRLRRSDPRWVLLLGWAVLVLAFFTVSPGKRDVYILPVLPALCIAAAPLLPGLLQRLAVQRVLASWLAVVALASVGVGLSALAGEGRWLQAAAARHGVDAAAVAQCGLWMVALGTMVAGCLAWASATRLRHIGVATVVAMAAVWTVYGVGLVPAVDADSSGRAIMREARRRVGADGELALLAWREQHLLQAGAGAAEFGFKRAWHAQWRDAGPWLQADPSRRWLFVLEDALDPCVDRQRAHRLGVSSRRTWWLVPGTALRAGCGRPSSRAPD